MGFLALLCLTGFILFVVYSIVLIAYFLFKRMTGRENNRLENLFFSIYLFSLLLLLASYLLINFFGDEQGFAFIQWWGRFSLETIGLGLAGLGLFVFDYYNRLLNSISSSPLHGKKLEARLSSIEERLNELSKEVDGLKKERVFRK